MKKYITITTMIMLSVATLVGCGKEKANGDTNTNATQKIASGENLTIPVK